MPDNVVRDVRVERYYPAVLAPAKEFKAIAAAENPELHMLWRILWKWYLNTFVYDFDIDGVKRWETMLRLRSKTGDTLEARRQRILARLNLSLPYTHRRLIEMLDATYGVGNAAIKLDYANYVLWVDISAAILFKTLSMRTFLRALIPANLSICVSKTVSAENRLYVVAHVRVSRRVIVRADLVFEATQAGGGAITGGAIGRRNYIIVRS